MSEWMQEGYLIEIMVKNNFALLLLGKDLRTIEKNNIVAGIARDQESFDELFGLLFHHERPLVVRAADAIEKITRTHKNYLDSHKDQLLILLRSGDHKELKGHIARIIPRLTVSAVEMEEVWHILTYWALNPNGNKIVRVNSLQALFDIARQFNQLKGDLKHTLQNLEHELSPSIQIRVKKLNKLMDKD